MDGHILYFLEGKRSRAAGFFFVAVMNQSYDPVFAEKFGYFIFVWDIEAI